MKGQALNPYLPGWEYVPDGEPHVFGDRIYIYGSHDRSHGTTFCIHKEAVIHVRAVRRRLRYLQTEASRKQR